MGKMDQCWGAWGDGRGADLTEEDHEDREQSEHPMCKECREEYREESTE